MHLCFIENASSESVAEKVSWYENHGFSSVFIFIAFSDYEKFEPMASLFSGNKLKLVGGFFPYISFKDELHEHGAVLIGLEETVSVIEINRDTQNLPHKTASKAVSAIMFVDALLENSEDHIDILNHILDPNLPIIGMGAGSIDLIYRPVLFTNTGFVKDSSILVLLESNVLQTTTHGYEALAGPFLTTQTDGNVTHELNYRSAFEVYSSSINSATEETAEQGKFFDWATTYPIGIENLDGSFIIRDPITTDGKGFTCVGSIPPDSIVYVMKGNAKDMLRKSQEAALGVSEIFEKEKKRKPQLVFSIGCVSRKMFLGDEYEEELRNAGLIDSVAHAGVLSLGEVSNYKASNATLLNKTLVLGVF